MKLTILGGGLSAISLACFLQNREDIAEINILEKEDRAGGLCRTFETNGIEYDVGPHIIFSKDKEILDFMNGLLEDNIAQIRRSAFCIKNALCSIRLKTTCPNCRNRTKTTASMLFCITPMKTMMLKICCNFFLKPLAKA